MQLPISVDDCWIRIMAWAKSRNLPLLRSLNPPASDAQIVQLETVIATQLPADFKRSWQIHNGHQDCDDNFVPPWDEMDDPDINDIPGWYYLLSCEEIAKEWRTWTELTKSSEFAGKQSDPDQGIHNAWWHPGWIPFASNGGGDSICIDLAPTEAGRLGQVITMNHASRKRQLLAPSFTNWLAALVQWTEKRTEAADA